MVIAHVTRGDEADPDHQNGLIDQVNTNTTDIAGKAAVCSDAGQDVADAGAAGSAVTAARCDHAHRGVSQIVAGTNITLSPTSGYGAVTVTAAAGGGGMATTTTTYTGDGTTNRLIDLGVTPIMYWIYSTATSDGRVWVDDGAYALMMQGLSVTTSFISGTSINVGSIYSEHNTSNVNLRAYKIVAFYEP